MANKVFVESLESRMMLSASAVPLLVAPHIVVQGQTVVIANGDTVASRQDFTDFGPMSTSGGATTRRFIIQNTGDAPLIVSTLKIVGLNAGDFRITKAPTTNIAPGAQAAVVVRFIPVEAGKRSASVVIRSNDPSIPKDTFVIGGKGLNTIDLPNGLKYATTVAGSGLAAAAGNGLKVDYTGFLLNGVVFDSSLKPGRTPFFFQIIDTTDPTKMRVIPGWNEGMQGMRPGEHRTLIIPASLGYGGSVQGSIPANSALVFEVKLLGYPSIHVQLPNAVRIPSGSTTISPSLGTQFGTTTKGHSISRTIILQSDDSQNAALGLTTINFSGTQAGLFTYAVSNYDSTLGGWPIRLTYKATRIGIANVTVSIPNSNPAHPNYTFAIHAKTVA